MILKGKKEDMDDMDDFDNEMDIGSDSDMNDFDMGSEGIAPMEKHKDLLKELTNFGPYMRDTINNWLGLRWDETAQSYIQDKDLLPIMNKAGAMWCAGVLKTYVRDNNIITNIDQEDYKNMMLDLISNVWLNLGTRKELGVNNHGDLLRICNELQHSTELILMGAGGGKYNQLLTHTVNRNESVNLNEMNNSNIQKEVVMDRENNLMKKIRKRLIGN